MLYQDPNYSLALQMRKLEAHLHQQYYLGYARQREKHVMQETDKPTNVFIAAALARVYGRTTPELKQRYETQRLYAHWLVLQQARLDVSNEMLSQHSGLDKETISLVQTGLAAFEHATDAQWSFFAATLADSEHDYDWVEAVLFGALGLNVDEDILEEVTQDIARLDTPPERQWFEMWSSCDAQEESVASIDSLLRASGWLQASGRYQAELFVGRKQELSKLQEWASGSHSPRCIIVTGMGGVGKSALAYHLINSLDTDAAKQSMVWHSGVLDTPRLVCEDGQLLGMVPTSSVSYISNYWDIVEAKSLQHPRHILVLDGLDEVDTTKLSTLLPDSSNYRVLITCRRVANHKSHWADIVTLDSLSHDDSVSLLQSYQQFTPTDEAFLDKTVEELGDLPLAITLTGHFLRYYGTHRGQELLPYLAKVLQVNLVRDMVPRQVTHSTTWFTLKALLAIYALLEAGDPVDRLARQLMNYVGTMNSDSLFSESFVRLSERLEKGVTIANALERLSQIGILKVDTRGTRQRYTIQDGLSDALSVVGDLFQKRCISDILFARSIGQRLGKDNTHTMALASVGWAEGILQERYDDIKVIKVTPESVIYEAFDTVSRWPVIIKQDRRGECTPNQHSPVCRNYTQVSLKLQWLAEYNIPAPRYQSLMHIGGKSSLVMTKIEGLLLDSYQDDHSLSERGKRLLLVNLCQQLAALHQRGIVHGDVKPANIIVDYQGMPWLVDWGTAHTVWDDDDSFNPRLAASTLIPSQTSEAIAADITAVGAVIDFLLPNPEPYLEPIVWKTYHKDAGYRSIEELQQVLLAAWVGFGWTNDSLIDDNLSHPSGDGRDQNGTVGDLVLTHQNAASPEEQQYEYGHDPHNEEHPRPSPDDRTRLYLALMVGTLFIVLALLVVIQSTTSTVLDKVLPMLTVVIGYFFGREIRRTRSYPSKSPREARRRHHRQK